MGEEEREGLADFRLNARTDLRTALGRRFRRFEADHVGNPRMDVSNKDPQRYVDTVGAGASSAGDGSADASPYPAPAGRADNSLGIGSLKGR
jgi:hypothetical protein